MTTKICNDCGEKKSISNFYKRGNGFYGSCKLCMSKKSKKWKDDNKEIVYLKNREWVNKNRKRVWGLVTLSGHKKKFEVKLTIDELMEYIDKKEYCELCGKKIEFFNASHAHNSPSLDRKNNDSCITKENIQFICFECNTMKGTKTNDELLEYCLMIVKRHGRIQ
jgi:hypothetical protein